MAQTGTRKAEGMARDIEADGFITRDEDLIRSVNMKEQLPKIEDEQIIAVVRWAWDKMALDLGAFIDNDGHMDRKKALAIKQYAERIKNES